MCPQTGNSGSKALDFAGGLAEEVDDKVLHAAFIPFGDITDIQIPLDYETGEFKNLNTFKVLPRCLFCSVWGNEETSQAGFRFP